MRQSLFVICVVGLSCAEGLQRRCIVLHWDLLWRREDLRFQFMTLREQN